MNDSELYGFSVFETLLLKQGKAWRLDYHWRRLSGSAEHYGMTAPDWPTFVRTILEHHDPTRNEVVRLTLQREGGPWSGNESMDSIRILKRDHKPTPAAAVSLLIDPIRLPCGDESRKHKTGSRIVYQSALARAKAKGAHDCIFIDDTGHFLETVNSNLFLYIDGNWVTPALKLGLLPGTTRDWLLGRSLVTSREIVLTEQHQCEAALISNAVHGLVAVKRINRRPLDIDLAARFMEEVGPREYVPIRE